MIIFRRECATYCSIFQGGKIGRLPASQQENNIVRDAIGKQQEAIEDVRRQSEVLDTLSNEILVAINKQQSSMNESVSSIQKLSDVAQVVADKTAQLNEMTIQINTIAHKLVEVTAIVND